MTQDKNNKKKKRIIGEKRTRHSLGGSTIKVWDYDTQAWVSKEEQKGKDAKWSPGKYATDDEGLFQGGRKKRVLGRVRDKIGDIAGNRDVDKLMRDYEDETEFATNRSGGDEGRYDYRNTGASLEEVSKNILDKSQINNHAFMGSRYNPKTDKNEDYVITEFTYGDKTYLHSHFPDGSNEWRVADADSGDLGEKLTSKEVKELGLDRDKSNRRTFKEIYNDEPLRNADDTNTDDTDVDADDTQTNDTDVDNTQVDDVDDTDVDNTQVDDVDDKADDTTLQKSTIVDTPGGKADSTKVDDTYVDPDGWTITNRFMISNRRKKGMYQIKDSKTGKIHKYPSLEALNLGVKSLWAADKPTQDKNETFRSIQRVIDDNYSDDEIGANQKRADKIYLAGKLKDDTFLPEDLRDVEKEIKYPANITQQKHKAAYRLSNPRLIKGYEGSALQKIDTELVGSDLPQFKTQVQYDEESNNLKSSIDLWQEEIDSYANYTFRDDSGKFNYQLKSGIRTRVTTLKKKILDAQEKLNVLKSERNEKRHSIKEPVTSDNDPLGLYQ
tara:strand:+ start:11580 stop:13238 length:1659 start_codon:yes stop_codon:yes gene_type:complete